MSINAPQNLGQRPASDGQRPASAQIHGEPVSRPRFVTVSIPDVNAIDFASLDQQGIFQSSPRQEPAAHAVQPNMSRRPLQNAVQPGLEAIRSAIEKSGSRSGINCGVVESARSHGQPPRPSPQSVVTPEQPGTTNSWLDGVDGNELQIQPLVQSILEHCPGCGTSIFMLAGTENNPQLEITAAKTALALQSRTGGRLLLIDSDPIVDGLTRHFGCRDFPGLTDLFLGKLGPELMLRSTSNPYIDFLPMGTASWVAPDKAKSVLKKILPFLSGTYDSILVNAGDAHGHPAATWTPFVVGTWLMVSLTGSNQAVAKSAVSQLTEQGARLLGCIVSEYTTKTR